MTWSSRCSGADSPQDGYSCGLWTLLHILSLGVAERHESVVGDIQRLSVSYAGRVMRSFIDLFFIHCESCRHLWITLYDEACCELHNSDHSIAERTNPDLNSEQQDWRQLAFWIWEIHNEISVQSKHAQGKGHYNKFSHIASTNLLWPSPLECPSCWQSKKSGNGKMTTDMNAYDRNAVYNHLKQTYWSRGVHNNRHILIDKWTKAKRHLSMQHLRERMQSHRGLTFNVVLLTVCVFWLVVARCKYHAPYYGARRRRKDEYDHRHNGDFDFESLPYQRTRYRSQQATKRTNRRSGFDKRGYHNYNL